MAEQSPVQQLIQSLAGIQTTAQQNASNSANNGNPNTVYNTSTWGYGGPPVMNSGGSWSTNQFSPAAVLQGLNLNLGGWTAPTNTNSGDPLGALRPVLPPGGITLNPSWPTTPPTPPNNGGGGGGGTPPVTPPQTVVDPPIVDTGNGTGGAGGGGIGTGGVGGGSGGGSGSVDLGNGWSGNVTGINLGSLAGTSLGNSLGVRGDGTLPWQQVVDIALEFIGLNGDWYKSQIGKWDKSEVMTSILNQIVPGLGNAVKSFSTSGFGERIFGNFQWFKNLRNMVLDGRILDTLNQQRQRNEDGQNASVLDDLSRDILNQNIDWDQFIRSNTPIVNGNNNNNTPTVTVGDVTPVDESGGGGGGGDGSFGGETDVGGWARDNGISVIDGSWGAWNPGGWGSVGNIEQIGGGGGSQVVYDPSTGQYYIVKL